MDLVQLDCVDIFEVRLLMVHTTCIAVKLYMTFVKSQANKGYCRNELIKILLIQSCMQFKCIRPRFSLTSR